MKRKIIGSVLILCMLLPTSFGVFAQSANSAIETIGDINGNIYEYDKLSHFSGWPWTRKKKTIVKNYNTLEVAAGVYYSEYIDGKWYCGILNQTGSVVKITENIWQATYSGKINY